MIRIRTQKKINRGIDRFIDLKNEAIEADPSQMEGKSKKYLKANFTIDRKTTDIYIVYYDDVKSFTTWKLASYLGNESHLISEDEWNRLLLLYKIGTL